MSLVFLEPSNGFPFVPGQRQRKSFLQHLALFCLSDCPLGHLFAATRPSCRPQFGPDPSVLGLCPGRSCSCTSVQSGPGSPSPALVQPLLACPALLGLVAPQCLSLCDRHSYTSIADATSPLQDRNRREDRMALLFPGVRATQSNARRVIDAPLVSV